LPPLPQACRGRIVSLSTRRVFFAMPVSTYIKYGEVASGYDDSRCLEPAIGLALIEGLRCLRARSVLEIGAGTGNYTCALMAGGLSVIALDRSPAMVEIGASKTPAH